MGRKDYFQDDSKAHVNEQKRDRRLRGQWLISCEKSEELLKREEDF